jgi:maltose alpha-D-glucosyltransferase/alpha-amylase
MDDGEAIQSQPAWSLNEPWENFSADLSAIEALEKNILPGYLGQCRWFGGKARKISSVTVDTILSLNSEDRGSETPEFFFILILKIAYATGTDEQYLLPLSLVPAQKIKGIPGKGIILSVVINNSEMTLIDAIYNEAFRIFLFKNLFHSSALSQLKGSLFFERGKGFKEADLQAEIISRVLDADQSNSAFIYQEKYFLKIYRKLFPETNPDVEVVSFLTEKADFTHIPAFAGSFSWKTNDEEITLGMMQEKVESITDAWSLIGDTLNKYLHEIVHKDASKINSSTLDQVALLGKRTAEMHLALGSDSGDDAFKPVPFTDEYRNWLLTNFDSLLSRRMDLAKENYSSLDEKSKKLADYFLESSGLIRDIFSEIKTRPLESMRIRIHGDYHLGQVLYNGSDYIILDFEGEPESSIGARKIRHSPMKDVAGMLRSFHYAVSAKFYFSNEIQEIPGAAIEDAAQHWYNTVSHTYLQQYFDTFGTSNIIGTDKSEHLFLLQLHLLEKAVYELGYEFNGRPQWVKIPLKGIEQVVKEILALR